MNGVRVILLINFSSKFPSFNIEDVKLSCASVRRSLNSLTVGQCDYRFVRYSGLSQAAIPELMAPCLVHIRLDFRYSTLNLKASELESPLVEF